MSHPPPVDHPTDLADPVEDRSPSEVDERGVKPADDIDGHIAEIYGDVVDDPPLWDTCRTSGAAVLALPVVMCFGVAHFWPGDYLPWLFRTVGLALGVLFFALLRQDSPRRRAAEPRSDDAT